MSTETRTLSSTLTGVTSYSGGGAPSYGTVTRAYRHETITGYRGPRHMGWNKCAHQKIVIERKGYVLPLKYQTVSSNIGPSAVYQEGTPYLTAQVGVSLSRADSAAMLSEILGEIPPVVSVPNMILELPSTLALWKDLHRPLMALFRDKGVRRRWKNGSDALLSQQFGLFPLIGDIKKLISSKRTVHTALQQILKEQSSGVSRISRRLPASAVSGSISGNRLSNEGYELVQSDPFATGCLIAKRRIRRYLDCSDPAIASAMAQALYGWNRPLSTLWEATPYSFVADWFLPVGDYLAGLEKSVFGDRMELVDLGWTAKARLTCSITRTLRDAYGSKATASCGSAYAECFQRGSGLPIATYLDDLTIPGIKQLTLGSALAFQRFA